MIDGNQSDADLRRRIAAAEAALEGSTFGARVRRKLLPDLIALGELAQRRGHHAEAEKLYTRGLAHCDELLRHRQLDAATFELHIELLGRTASAMLTQGKSEEAIPTYRRAIALVESLGKDAREDTGIAEVLGACHGQLAIALDERGSSDESFGHYRISLACAESIHAHDPNSLKSASTLALAHNAIGHHYAEAGQLHDAFQHHSKSLEINAALVQSEAADDDGRYCLATDHENLCDVLLRQKQPHLARKHAEAALSLRQQIAGSPAGPEEWSMQLVDSHREVAELCMAEGNADGAYEHYWDALAISRKLAKASPEDPERSFQVADCLLALGSTREAKGEPERALDLYRLALEIDLELAERQPKEPRWPANAAHCHLCSALLLLNCNRSAEAHQHGQQGIEILEREIEARPDHPHLRLDLSLYCSDYAGGLASQGDRLAALEHFHHSLILDRALVDATPDDPTALGNYAVTLDHIASMHEGLGDFSEALVFNRQALWAEERLADSDKESTEYQSRLIQTLLNVASTSRELKELLEAQKTLKRAERIAKRLLRLTPHEETAVALNAQVHRELGRMMRQAGDHGSAEQKFIESVDCFSSLVEGSEHPESWLANQAQSLEALAELQIDLGQAKNALRPLAQALANWQRIARRHPSEANVHRDLAHSHELSAEAHEAIADMGGASQHRRAAERLYERFGEEHPK